MSKEEITKMLRRAPSGDLDHEVLLPMVYEGLRGIAADQLRRERSGHTLQPTALVHDAYLKLVDQERVEWQGRSHFLAVAAQAMRRILIDHARARNAEKRGGEWRRVTLHDAYAITRSPDIDVLAVDDALRRMHEIHERAAKVAEQRIFAGATNAEVAAMLDVAERTVERDWKWAKAWLRRDLLGEEEEEGDA